MSFVCDFYELSALRDFINAMLDHQHLNDVLGRDRITADMGRNMLCLALHSGRLQCDIRL
jgi:6-pyruvoyl-tetrahydropterin synthase